MASRGFVGALELAGRLRFFENVALFLLFHSPLSTVLNCDADAVVMPGMNCSLTLSSKVCFPPFAHRVDIL